MGISLVGEKKNKKTQFFLPGRENQIANDWNAKFKTGFFFYRNWNIENLKRIIEQWYLKWKFALKNEEKNKNSRIKTL